MPSNPEGGGEPANGHRSTRIRRSSSRAMAPAAWKTVCVTSIEPLGTLHHIQP